MEEVTKNIGEFLKSLRKSKGMTLIQLQEESGVSNSYLSQIENGKFKPSSDVLKKLSKPLNVPYFELMYRAGYIPEELYKEQKKQGGLNMDALKELVEELNKKVEDLNSALYVENLLSLIEDSIGTFYPHQIRLVEDLLSLIEDVTEIAAALSNEIND